MDEPIIPRKYLYTIKWTQPYATDRMRPYLRTMQEAVERAIEAQLERNECPQAKGVIERIMRL
jgi:hypothetical protein